MKRACGGLAILVTAACGAETPLTRWVPQRPPHEAYAESLRAAGLDASAAGRAWLEAADTALSAPQRITLPFREAGYFDPLTPAAVGYRFDLPRGRALTIAVTLEADAPGALFVDLFAVNGDRADRVAGAEAGQRELRYVSRRDGAYLLRVQPELLRGGRYTIVERTDASLRFPVDGANDRDVHSVFGDARDGGRRDHHGVDIFAPRGTPVVAAADGVVRGVSTTTLGGRVVWLSDQTNGQSIYYAHLQEWRVEEGQRVKAGDVLGLVGNTGNARTTPPHLHFGIYRNGPLDPLPFIRRADPEPRAPSADARMAGAWGRATRRVALRPAPDGDALPIDTLDAATAVRVRAAAAALFRVTLPDGREGYVEARAIAALRDPTRVGRLDAGAPLRSQPSAQGVVVRMLEAGTRVRVFARFNGFDLVDAGRAGRGWLSTVEPLRGQ